METSHNELVPLNPGELNLPKSIERINSHTGAIREIVDLGHTFYKKSKQQDDEPGFHYHPQHDELMLAPGSETTQSLAMERRDSLHEHTGVREEKNVGNYPKSMPNLESHHSEVALLPGDTLHLPAPIERLGSHTGVVREFSRCSDTSCKSTDLIPYSADELNLPKSIERIDSHTGVKKEIVRKQEVKDPANSSADVINKARRGLGDHKARDNKAKDQSTEEEFHDSTVGEWNVKPGTKKRVQKQIVIREKKDTGKVDYNPAESPERDVYVPKKFAEEPAEQPWVEVTKTKGFTENTTPKKATPPTTSSGRRLKVTSPKNLFGSSAEQILH
jgi:hypothetical protein